MIKEKVNRWNKTSDKLMSFVLNQKQWTPNYSFLRKPDKIHKICQ